MTEPNTPSTKTLSNSQQENERTRNKLFSPRPISKGKAPTLAEEEQEKARRAAQDEYMDRLDKQFIQR
jgi:hypothetical protein